ncbi:MAG: DUF4293 domain-containing protein [Prevotellaceae bacterium]|jgi:hypothetical protein|nr:DUF4293 domain-containing protein [Prevotellaceae bacterium]
MIQRIQSLYLLIVTILQTILFFSKQGTFITSVGQEETPRIADMWPMAILIGATALLAFFTIFLYHHRITQIRLTIFNGLLLIMLQAVIVYLLIKASNMTQETTYSLNAIFPIVSAILCYLAVRGIGKDEAMIKALDRLR